MKKCILICDDDEDILHVCKLILEKNNFRVVTSDNCEDIFDTMETTMPDLILMDVWIPEMGGEAATKKLKTLELTKQIPVILLSAHKELDVVAQRASADGFIQKPFEISELLNKINTYVYPKDNNQTNFSNIAEAILRFFTLKKTTNALSIHHHLKELKFR
ncbi:MAG: response regulator [Chitinophagales bacterium]|nr:response regulator [Chitinophagales bacterium]